MAFRLLDRQIGATDDAKGITVKLSFRFTDVVNEVPYSYVDGDLEFEFETVSESGLPAHGELVVGETELTSKTLVEHVRESSVRRGLLSALGPDALAKVDLESIKAAIAEAVFVISSDDGRYLRFSPDFKVDFI